MRYELKILLSSQDKEKVLKKIFSHPNMIREIYHERQINNIYFDTTGYSDYLASANGADMRKKYRIRWYGEQNQKEISSLLELKYKKGMVGSKKFVSMPTFSLENSFSYVDLFHKIRENFHSYSPEEQFLLGELLGRSPVLLNTYTRRYFVTDDEKFRLTLDENMCFYSLYFNQPYLFVGRDKNLLIEIKFDAENVKDARKLVNSLGLRVGKNSKYVNGVNFVLHGAQPSVI